MSLTRKDQMALAFIAFEPLSANEPMPADFEAAKQLLLDQALVEVRDGILIITPLGFDALSPMARRSLQRPKNFFELSPVEQWAVDERLGILDWDGC
jgi:hypothetical protein